MMKKGILVLLAMMMVMTMAMPSVLAEFEITTTESEETPATPTNPPVLNLGITEDPKPTATPEPPAAQAGGSMMMAPVGGESEGAEQTGEVVDEQPVGEAAQSYFGENGEMPRFGKTNKKGVNVRATPSAKGKNVTRIGVTGTVVQIVNVEEKGKDVWFSVTVGNKSGYIRADLIDVITEDEYRQGEAAEAAKRKANTSRKPSESNNSSSNDVPTVDNPGYVLPPQDGVHEYDGCSQCLSEGLG